MSVTSTSLPTIGLGLEDFRRLGVRPHEYRLTVIRRAAARSARALAEQQLTSPSDQVGLQLSRVATSTYRLLDPRQRKDVHQRAYVGRILPSALSSAGQTSFHSGSTRTIPSAPFSSDAQNSDAASDAELIELLDLESKESNRLVTWTASLNDEDLLDTTPITRRITRARKRLQHPWIMLVLAGLVIGTLLGLTTMGSRYSELAEQRNQSTAVSEFAPRQDLSAPTSESVQPDIMPAIVPKRESVSPESVSPESVSSESVSSESVSSESVSSESVSSESVSPESVSSESVSSESVSSESVSSESKSASSLEMTDGLSDVPDVPEVPEVPEVPGVGIPDLGIPDVVVEPLEMSINDPGAISEQPLDGSDFLSDPFALWGSDDPPPFKQDLEIPTFAVPDSDLAEPLAVSASMTELDPSRSDDVTEPAVPRRAVPDQPSVRAARAQLVLLVPALGETVVPQAVEERIAQIEALEKDLIEGTPDAWTARMMIAELAWLVEDAPQVGQRLKSLAETYQVQLHQLLAETFVAACDLARLPDTREHLLNCGLKLADQLLLAESFQDCQRVVEGLGESAEFLGSQSGLAYLKQLSQAADQMSRSSEASRRLIDDAGEVKSDAGDVGIVGRYYCLMLRRWDTGLPWLVEASDSRIASAARQELELADSASTDDLITISQRWLTVASRSSGRAADSMRIHAIDLMRKAQLKTSGLKRLEIERTIDETLEVLPPFLRDINPSLPDTTTSIVTEEPTPAASAKPKNGLSGRIKIDGQDIGVQLNYELDVALTQSVLDTIAKRADRESPRMSIQLVGELHLDDSATIVVSIGAAEQDVFQHVQVDDAALEFDPLDQGTEVALGAGTHQVTWTIEAERLARAILRLHDAATGRRLTVVHPAADAAADRPTTLTVAMVRGDS